MQALLASIQRSNGLHLCRPICSLPYASRSCNGRIRHREHTLPYCLEQISSGSPPKQTHLTSAILDWHLMCALSSMQAETPIKVGATAGLRLLPGGQSDAILLAVQTFLAASPFKLDPQNGVTVLDGEPRLAHHCLHLLLHCCGFLRWSFIYQYPMTNGQPASC